MLTVHADAISSQGKASAGVDLGVGLLLLAVGGLLATGRLHGRQRTPVPAGTEPQGRPEKKNSWAARVLAEPRLGLAMLVGADKSCPSSAVNAPSKEPVNWPARFLIRNRPYWPGPTAVAHPPRRLA